MSFVFLQHVHSILICFCSLKQTKRELSDCEKDNGGLVQYKWTEGKEQHQKMLRGNCWGENSMLLSRDDKDDHGSEDAEQVETKDSEGEEKMSMDGLGSLKRCNRLDLNNSLSSFRERERATKVTIPPSLREPLAVSASNPGHSYYHHSWTHPSVRPGSFWSDTLLLSHCTHSYPAYTHTHTQRKGRNTFQHRNIYNRNALYKTLMHFYRNVSHTQ